VVHYLDNAATTPVRQAAIDAMVPLWSNEYGNPSGSHRMARAANRVLDDARDVVAESLGAKPGEVVFTAGGTEADNLAIRGMVEIRGGTPVCSAVEHHAILDSVTDLGGRIVGVTTDGRIDLPKLRSVLQAMIADGETPSIVSVMLANNETGVIQPIDEVADVLAEVAPDAVLHTDAVQAMSWVDVAAAASRAQMISISAHKFGGPKGVGALVVRDGLKLKPLLLGGGQERDRRGGTQNVPGIAGMATALAITVANRPSEIARLATLRDHLIDRIVARIDGVHESGVGRLDRTDTSSAMRSHKTANIAHLCFEDIESEALLFLLEKADVMASAASSCASGAQDPSHVLAAMGYDRGLAQGSLRLSLGYITTEADIDAAIESVSSSVERLRSKGR